MTENNIPLATKLVNDALVKYDMEAHIDYKLKSLLILIIDEAIKLGYIKGMMEGLEEIHKNWMTMRADEFTVYLDKLMALRPRR